MREWRIGERGGELKENVCPQMVRVKRGWDGLADGDRLMAVGGLGGGLSWLGCLVGVEDA